MNERSPLDWLNDARNHSLEARDIARRLDQGAFEASRRDQLAILYCLVVVGEALSEVPKDIQALASEIPWARIRGLRNRLVHSYFLIDNEIVLRIAQHDTESLVASIDRLIEKIR